MIKSLTDGGQTTVNWVFNYIVYVSNPVWVRRLERYAPRTLLFFLSPPIVVHNFTATALQSLEIHVRHIYWKSLWESVSNAQLSAVLRLRRRVEKGEEVSRRIKSIVSPLWWYYIEIKLQSYFLKSRHFSEACVKNAFYIFNPPYFLTSLQRK